MMHKSKLLITLILAVVVVWLLFAIGSFYYFDTWENRGAFGDLFGAVNALFSGLAFAVLIYTIVLQREDIKQNREEITRNRKELAKSAKLQQKAQDILTQQVAQTHLSAKINAMQILVDYYNNQISNTKSTAVIIEKAKQKRKDVIKKIDELIDGLDNSDVD